VFFFFFFTRKCFIAVLPKYTRTHEIKKIKEKYGTT